MVPRTLHTYTVVPSLPERIAPLRESPTDKEAEEDVALANRPPIAINLGESSRRPLPVVVEISSISSKPFRNRRTIVTHAGRCAENRPNSRLERCGSAHPWLTGRLL